MTPAIGMTAKSTKNTSPGSAHPGPGRTTAGAARPRAARSRKRRAACVAETIGYPLIASTLLTNCGGVTWPLNSSCIWVSIGVARV